MMDSVVRDRERKAATASLTRVPTPSEDQRARQQGARRCSGADVSAAEIDEIVGRADREQMLAALGLKGVRDPIQLGERKLRVGQRLVGVPGTDHKRCEYFLHENGHVCETCAEVPLDEILPHWLAEQVITRQCRHLLPK